MSKNLVLSLLVVVVLAIALLAVPRPVTAQLNGGWVDEIVFSVLDQDQAVASVSSGDTDVYVFSLDSPTDKIAAQNDPNINVMQAFSGFKGLALNPVPHGPTVGGFNPFTVREIREAMNWAFDREFIVSEFAGGFAIPMTTAHFSVEPGFVRDVAWFAKQEAKYAFDFAKAKSVVDAAMGGVTGASLVGGKWQVSGENVEVIIVQRIEDYRFDIGAYVATVIDDLGFTSVLDPSPFDEALDTVYFSDPTRGAWHMYTEGWGATGFTQFDDGQAPFFYADIFGAIYDEYVSPQSVEVPCQALDQSQYADLNERRDLLRACIEEGMMDPVRVFLEADSDVYIYNEGVSGFTFDIFAGNQNFWGLRNVRIDGATGGTLQVAQPIHTGSAWNIWGGFTDVYSEYQRKAFVDPGVITHPHLGVTIPFRADFEVTTVGPTGQMDVPEDALFWNTSSSAYEAVGAGVTSKSMVEYTYTWGEWHHGELITMDDVKMTLAYMMRLADTLDGDLAALSPAVADDTAFVRFNTSFRGVKFVDDDTAVVWMDTWNPDETLIANRADIWPEYPWELNALMAASVLNNETSFNDEDAGLLGNVELDLAKGPTFPFLDAQLANLSAIAVNFIPAGLDGAGNITDAEATARWAALNSWRTAGTTVGNFMVSNGPYFLDQYITTPEGAVYKAKRTGYPFDINKWEFLAEIKVPDVTLGPAPQVKLSFPAIFTFTTTLAGESYDLIAQTGWLITDPATRDVLFDGVAFQTGPGAWAVQLTGAQTATLAEGTFEFTSIVVGLEAALPVVSRQTFTALDLEKAILADLTNTLDIAIAGFGDEIDALTNAVDDAVAVADSATALANTLLIIAIIGVVVAVIAIVGLVVMMRRLPPRT